MAKSADNNKDTDADIAQCKQDVLRARDIIPSDNKKNPQTTSADIPKLDLAEQIMAEQRKVIAAKRKAPGAKIEAISPPKKTQSRYFYMSQPTQDQSQENRIIAQIVARDIEKLYRGVTSRL